MDTNTISSVETVCNDERCAEFPNPVLCCCGRSGITENIYRGVVCCVQLKENGSHQIIYSAGNRNQLFYPRSALKFVQVLPILENGVIEEFGFTEEEVAVMCASHNAEPQHLEVVRSILKKAGLQESDLGCGGHTPISEKSALKYAAEGCDISFSNPIYNNCSGKHAGFLALAKKLGCSLHDYLDMNHPIQLLIREAICDMFGVQPGNLHGRIDGCSAPAYAVNAEQAALAYAKLSKPEWHPNPARQASIQTMINAVTAYPFMVYGTNGFCTVLMENFRGKVIGKRGAAGVYTSGLVGKGIGCAVKIDDGTMGPQYNVTMKFLDWVHRYLTSQNENVDEDYQHCLNVPRMQEFLNTQLKNYMAKHVGWIVCNSNLFKDGNDDCMK